jgi:hypothetical protein
MTDDKYSDSGKKGEIWEGKEEGFFGRMEFT